LFKYINLFICKNFLLLKLKLFFLKYFLITFY
jgi:hypothetical protein